VPVVIKTRRGETVVDTDEHPKHGTTVEVVRREFDPADQVWCGLEPDAHVSRTRVVQRTLDVRA
jgi:hypothetical protein